MKNLFNIYHPLNGDINHDCARHHFAYEQVAIIQADSLLDAFRLAQNDFNEEYNDLDIRSTCVGDIITESDEFGRVTCHMVQGMGFSKVPLTTLAYVDPELNNIIHEHIAIQMLENPEDYGLI